MTIASNPPVFPPLSPMASSAHVRAAGGGSAILVHLRRHQSSKTSPAAFTQSLVDAVGGEGFKVRKESKKLEYSIYHHLISG